MRCQRPQLNFRRIWLVFWYLNLCKTSDWLFGNQGFASAGGGVWAMALTAAGVSVWRWNRNNIPYSISNNNPTAATFGMPVATWPASSCSPSHFNNLTLVL